MMATRVFASPAEIVIRKRSITTLELLAVVAALISFGFGSFFLWLLNTTGPARSGSGLTQMQNMLVILGLGAASVLVPLMFWLRQARAVHLSDSGVRIDYPLRVRSFPWSELMKVEGVGLGTVTFRPVSSPTNIVGGWFSISIEQARVILSDPRCPSPTIRDELRRAIFES
jgi:hypothetical protein